MSGHQSTNQNNNYGREVAPSVIRRPLARFSPSLRMKRILQCKGECPYTKRFPVIGEGPDVATIKTSATNGIMPFWGAEWLGGSQVLSPLVA
jgi:hypothetical protein